MRFAAPPTHPCSRDNAICVHTLQNTNWENRLRVETIQTVTAAHTHTQGTLHRRLQPLNTEKHTVLCTRCRTPRENQLHSKRSKPHPPHTQGTLHRRLQPLYTEKRTVACSGFLPNTNPMQHSCSHYNAFCSSIAM